ncbi:MAG: amidinotransferase [Flavobacteriales bacterium]|nr:amidinotransferase [Flavobacteriales bacterium]
MSNSEIIMVRPCSFGFNEQTALSNHFQRQGKVESSEVNSLAQQEFDQMVNTLTSEGISVRVYQDNLEPYTPDSIFPNNWFATHPDGTIVIFPMEAENRRLERREDIINELEVNYRCQRIVDLSDAENIGVYLEGTGSIVFDHQYQLAFSCRSSRTNETLFRDYCKTIDYTPFIFDALDANRQAIYHTNVLMNIGSKYVVICLEAIPTSDRQVIINHIKITGKELIEISLDQMDRFAGNMLELKGNDGLVSVISQTAFESLSEDQKRRLENSSKLIPIAIPTIESIGGGSVRCMIAENLLPPL